MGRTLHHKAVFRLRGEVAQLVEHRTENAGVGGSSPPLAISKRPSRTRVGRFAWCRQVVVDYGIMFWNQAVLESWGGASAGMF